MNLGNMNMQQMMQQAKNLQKKMQDAQEEQKGKVFTGESGNGMVKVEISGDGNCKGISINDSLCNIDEKEMLEDLIVAAINNAKDASSQESGDMMSKIGIDHNILKNMPF